MGRGGVELDKKENGKTGNERGEKLRTIVRDGSPWRSRKIPIMDHGRYDNGGSLRSTRTSRG